MASQSQKTIEINREASGRWSVGEIKNAGTGRDRPS